ncbi:hypothetical protein ACFY3M_46460 [Streptomyces mirabilis]|uniref:hypothetical protein n=1 Tax=Streptomyces mirabilis TaxID=68239 RepID=UPI0036C2F2EE
MASCFAGRVEVTVSPGDAVERRLCVRTGAMVSVTLRPRADDRRWTAVRSRLLFSCSGDWSMA